MNTIISGTNIIADNWQFMVVANFINGSVDPNEDWGWVASTQENTLRGDIQAGVFQLDCLINLLEQVVFTNSISLMEQWIPSWANANSSLNKLFDEENGDFISALDLTEFDIAREKQFWLDQLLWNEKLTEKFQKGMAEFKRQDFANGTHLFWSQVINGIADYLALANVLELTYSPHSARAGFLKSTLWHNPHQQHAISAGVDKFHSIVNTSRTQLSELLGYQRTLSNLTISLPSTAILCIAESTSPSSIIDTALELRNNSEIKALRQILHELTVSINSASLGHSSSFKEVKEKVELLEAIVLKVEKELTDTKKIEKGEVPGKIDLDYFNLKNHANGLISNHNEYEHSGVIAKLLLTSGTRTNQIIKDKLQLNSAKISKQFIQWHSHNFFEQVSSAQSINLYNITMENNYINNGSAGIVGPDGKIINSKIEQHSSLPDASGVDLKALSEELETLLARLKETASSAEEYAQCAAVAEAKEEAKKGNGSKALGALKKAGKWVFDTATQIGIRLTAALLKEMMK